MTSARHRVLAHTHDLPPGSVRPAGRRSLQGPGAPQPRQRLRREPGSSATYDTAAKD
ncbi:hypothetical protein [Streptomyces sp. CB00455]|uniref:hypothetical protein n=1 Tax=Streptomyces sp. CB00455 TaxID=1703927 RepID=UPI000AB277BA|nr:hypothetical protein [Streptomyces sp. CB00455]